jgi:hypothetical protein
MMGKMRSLLVLLLCVMAASLQASEPVTPRGKIRLFNGRNLDGFYVSMAKSGREDPQGVFRVEGGCIHVSSFEWGGLTTRDEYRDYHLIVEWKWGGKTWAPRLDKARDSGILIHGVGEDGKGGNGWLESIEYQMIEGGTGDLLLVRGAGRPEVTAEVRRGPDGQPYWQKGGQKVRLDRSRLNWYGRDEAWKDKLGYRGPNDVEKPSGQWNRSEIVSDGGTLTYYLNGRIVNQAAESTHGHGKIQIQSEGAEVIVRKMELRPLKRR